MNGFSSRLSTWGQVRTSVYMEGPFSSAFSNISRHYEYIPDMTAGPSLGITAVESGNRLFRGCPFGCSGYNTNIIEDFVVVDQYFNLATTLDFTDRPLLLLDSVWTGDQTVTVESEAYDGTTANGQEISVTPDIAGTVTTIELAS